MRTSIWLTATFGFAFIANVNSFRVAVIGGGVGGTSAAYFLRNLLGDNDAAQVDLYEADDRIGGRIKSVEFHGKNYEIGASIIHEKNHYAVSFANKFGLLHRNKSVEQMGIFDGSQFVFKESKWSVVTLWRLVTRYGIDILKLPFLVKGMLRDFSWIYILQKDGKSFGSVSDLLQAMNSHFPELTSIPLKHFLIDEVGISERAVEELVQATTLVNYGQNVTEMHGLVGSVSAAGFAGDLWSISGGNEQLPQFFAKASAANVFLKSTVSTINLENEKYTLDINGKTSTTLYDAVIIATPLFKESLEFTGFPKSVNDYVSAVKDLQYHKTVATLVAGKAIGIGDGSVNSVISCNPNLFFLSCSQLQPVQVDGTHTVRQSNVYKIFSPERLSRQQLDELFTEIKEVKVTEWLAYPQYSELHKLNTLPNFTIHPGLFHINAIEWGASAMEMSMIGAKNAALLVKHFLHESGS